MLRFVNALPPTVAVAGADWGQSNRRPWGDRDLQGYPAAPHLRLSPNGQDLTIISIEAVSVGHGDVGSRSLVTVSELLPADHYEADGELRLIYVNWGLVGVQSRPGHAKVISNTDSTLLVEWLSALQASSNVTMPIASPGVVTWTGHPFQNNDPVMFSSTEQLPTGVDPGVTYYVRNRATDTFELAVEPNGVSINFTGTQSGTHKGYIGRLTGLGGYVRLTNDRWKTYDNVRVLTPYQPESPGPYPAFVGVPGKAHPSSVQSYEDTGLFLPFSWEEGIDGHGFVGAGTINAGNPLQVDIGGGGAITDKVFAGGLVIVTGTGAAGSTTSAYGTVVSNTTSTITVASWTGTPPSNPNTFNFEVLVPHWRDNPNRVLQGFRYPSNDMQPGGYSILSPGTVYNRPAGRLAIMGIDATVVESSYKAAVLTQGAVRAAINGSGLAQTKAFLNAGFRAAIVAGELRIDRLIDMTVLNRTTANQQMDFGEIFATGQLAFIVGWPTGGTATVTFNTSDNTISPSIFLEGVTPKPLADGQTVEFRTTGKLPVGVLPSTDYYPFVPQVVTVTAGTDRVNLTGHGLPERVPLTFTAGLGGAVPTGLSAGATYYVRNVQPNSFQVSLTPDGPVVDITGAGTAPFLVRPSRARYFARDVGGSTFRIARTPGGPAIDFFGVQEGVHTGNGETINGVWRVKTVSPPLYTLGGGSSGVTISIGSPAVVTKVAHGLVDGNIVSFKTTGSLPTGIVAGVSYLVDMLTADTFNLFTIDVSTGAPAPGPIVNTSGTQDGVHSVFNQGSFIELEAVDKPTPPSVAYLFGDADVIAQRGSMVVRHRFGSLLNEKWQLANMSGRTMFSVLLGINSSGQFLTEEPNRFCYSGQIGWFKDDFVLDWTPSNPVGLAARFRKLLTTIAPAALLADAATAALQLRYAFINGSQGEAEAIEPTGRALYHQMLPTFIHSVRKWIVDAGLSLYPNDVPIPVHHAPITKSPWELDGVFYGLTLTGDKDGLVNKAIADFVARDGMAASIEVEDLTKMSGGMPWFPPDIDPLHFDGAGEAKKGEREAAVIAALLDYAIAFRLVHSQAAIDICNLALAHLGHAPVVTAIEPPDASAEARLCARYYPLARDAVLDARPWSFCRHRKALVEVENTRTEWRFAYAVPRDVRVVDAVIPENASDDLLEGGAPPRFPNQHLERFAIGLVPQDYRLERDVNGYRIIYTNQENAHIRYQAVATDPSLFPHLFRMALSWQLAAMLAGPLLKGEQGAAMALRASGMLAGFLAQASEVDANQGQMRRTSRAPWMQAR